MLRRSRLASSRDNLIPTTYSRKSARISPDSDEICRIHMYALLGLVRTSRRWINSEEGTSLEWVRFWRDYASLAGVQIWSGAISTFSVLLSNERAHWGWSCFFSSRAKKRNYLFALRATLHVTETIGYIRIVDDLLQCERIGYIYVRGLECSLHLGLWNWTRLLVTQFNQCTICFSYQISIKFLKWKNSLACS